MRNYTFGSYFARTERAYVSGNDGRTDVRDVIPRFEIPGSTEGSVRSTGDYVRSTWNPQGNPAGEPEGKGRGAGSLQAINNFVFTWRSSSFSSRR